MPRYRLTPEQKLELFHTKTAYAGDCIVWTGCIDRSGYGMFCGDEKFSVKAHRYIYEKTHGLIPPGLQIDHLCRNRACVNTAHLQSVTQQENMRRGCGVAVLNAAKTRCGNGHEYAGRNLISYRNMRYCRACMNERNRKQRLNKGVANG